MKKGELNTVSELVAFESIPQAKDGESLEDYIQRAYPAFEQFVGNSENPVIKEIKENSVKELHNAISKLSARRMLVKRWCMKNDPFDVQPPEEATDAEILDHNDIEASVEQMIDVMGEDNFRDYIDRLKTPKKDGHTQTEIRQMSEEHHGKYEPAYPSEKEYTHGSGGTTRKFHWEKALKDQFRQDHQKFLNEYGLEDSFPETESEDAEQEQEPAETDSE